MSLTYLTQKQVVVLVGVSGYGNFIEQVCWDGNVCSTFFPFGNFACFFLVLELSLIFDHLVECWEETLGRSVINFFVLIIWRKSINEVGRSETLGRVCWRRFAFSSWKCANLAKSIMSTCRHATRLLKITDTESQEVLKQVLLQPCSMEATQYRIRHVFWTPGKGSKQVLIVEGS